MAPSFGISAGCYEKARKYRFDDVVGDWKGLEVLVKFEAAPFTEGKSRFVHRLWVKEAAGANDALMAAKLYKRPASLDTYMKKASVQILATRIADVFSARCNHAVEFIPIHILVLKDGTVCTIEPFLHGDFNKHIDHEGRPLSQDIIPPALCHFSYFASEKEVVLANMQGVGHQYTNPSMHVMGSEPSSRPEWSKRADEDRPQRDYGVAFQTKAIQTFCCNHECNHVCNKLGLTPTVNDISRAQMVNAKLSDGWKRGHKWLKTSKAALSGYCKSLRRKALRAGDETRQAVTTCKELSNAERNSSFCEDRSSLTLGRIATCSFDHRSRSASLSALSHRKMVSIAPVMEEEYEHVI